MTYSKDTTNLTWYSKIDLFYDWIFWTSLQKKFSVKEMHRMITCNFKGSLRSLQKNIRKLFEQIKLGRATPATDIMQRNLFCSLTCYQILYSCKEISSLLAVWSNDGPEVSSFDLADLGTVFNLLLCTIFWIQRKEEAPLIYPKHPKPLFNLLLSCQASRMCRPSPVLPWLQVAWAKIWSIPSKNNSGAMTWMHISWPWLGNMALV